MNVKEIKFSNLSIKNKLIMTFLLIGIVPAILLAILVGWTVDRIIEQQVHDNTVQLIEKVNDAVEAHIENVQNMTYFISFNPTVDEFFSGNIQVETMSSDEQYELTKFLQSFTTLHPEIAGILIVNEEEQYFSNELYSRTTFSLKSESWYREAVENQGIAKVLGRTKGRKIASHVNYREDEIVSVVRAIIDPISQEVKGVILIDLKLRVIAETIKDVRLGKTGYLMVLDRNGEKIYSPTHSILQNISLIEALQSNNGTFSKKVNGESLQFIYRTSTFTNWTMVGVFPSNDTIPEVQQIQFFVVSFLFFVCLFGITASYFLSHSISKPIHELMMAMEKAESGDLSIRYKGVRKDEVGKLGRSFNSMLHQIDKLIKLTEQQERKKREAEFRTLQANIKPHFLYNTLDTIQWMARKKNAPDVAEMVGSLSKLFKIGLSKGKTIIPVREEVEHIKSYLKIQSVRYQKKLNYEITVSPKIEQVSILKMVLQPVVENAIYHGIKERRTEGFISIELTEKEEILFITIRDNGKGMNHETLQQLRYSLASFVTTPPLKGDDEDTTGYGLANVHARLKLTFGEEYCVNIESEENKGTTVSIIHPILLDNKKIVR